MISQHNVHFSLDVERKLHVSATKDSHHHAVHKEVKRRHLCRSPAEILGSNPTGGMDICLL